MHTFNSFKTFNRFNVWLLNMQIMWRQFDMILGNLEFDYTFKLFCHYNNFIEKGETFFSTEEFSEWHIWIEWDSIVFTFVHFETEKWLSKYI